jgi:hypothetical protein
VVGPGKGTEEGLIVGDSGSESLPCRREGICWTQSGVPDGKKIFAKGFIAMNKGITVDSVEIK